MKSLKKMIDDFLKRLAAQNKEQFGDEKLDCCKVGRPKQKDK
ncbi:MAG TPA: LDCC motif putative metal-binding protein [Bacillota bacterium]|mgnify:FL=1|nr:LDCC motif putative metal-binding protein [Bacillota bacterium]